VLVDPKLCTLSAWQGDEDRCRWCNELLGPRRRVWHDGACMKIFREQHRYTQARRWCHRTSKGVCPCARPKGAHRHSVCAHCGLCEPVLIERGLALECNHIIPRLGDKSSFSCLHHHENLEMLCSDCHKAETNLQKLLYPEMRKRGANKNGLPGK
jgi:5-methylcytosine-specific restriction endonuclease McrA